MNGFRLYSLFTILLISCCKEESTHSRPIRETESLTTQQKEGIEIATSLWKTTPLQPQPLNESRMEVFRRIQKYADQCSDTYFENYLNSLSTAAENLEKHDALLYFYRLAFDRILNDLQNIKVENGTTIIWMLYNMGYIIKTPSGCFGIDIMHYWADRLEPYLDFLCVTHNHRDHYDTKLITAMLSAGKPVLSNYLAMGKEYTSKVPTEYRIGNFSIRTSITDHNNSGLSSFVTVFSINCGNDSGNFTLMHTGDSNYKPSQYTNILNRINILIPRYAPNALTENNIIGEERGQTLPDYILLSHILELSHGSAEESRWSLFMGLERVLQLNNDHVYVPMWGEKMIWKSGKLLSEK